MKLYTKTGDKGETGLYGGERVSKAAQRVAAYGAVDEANAAVGLARAHLDDASLDSVLAAVQHGLFDLGADLATPLASRYRQNITPLDDEDIGLLERFIDRFDAELEPLRAFILPSGHPAGAALHLARTVVRRAEREAVALAEREAVNEAALVYLNRLSDLLFVLARIVNARAGVPEAQWRHKGRKEG
jgi:cob(I)alamin adenosyltransferase